MQLCTGILHNLHTGGPPVFSDRAAREEDVRASALDHEDLAAAAAEYSAWLDDVHALTPDPEQSDLR